MSLLIVVNAMFASVDTLDSIAGDLLSLEATVTTGKLDADTAEHVRTSLAATRRKVMQVTQTLHDARRATR